ncbi:hypothetical protein B0H15DRAFT_783554 [Mycena belliarum]|uniref:DUF6570 domain-containing protein n=1 Tax=Mycena belliarum TaxID=1033014 RepID=A0AAD6U411_9AGAR|nr:hypothetical protein B0H15DRAFT_783554 [Mycena belliae]
MIARCRAKCWIIQLKEEDDYSTPITQRGVRGHVIVYPQKPSAIAKVLPPSISDIITPICVIFVGSTPPTTEWLQKKAKPLTVHKEKVLNALHWLQAHNPLYKDIEINPGVFAGQPDEAILPFHVQHIIPSVGISASTSSYVPGNDPAGTTATTAAVSPILSDILNPPTTDPIPFESVMVANIEGHTSPNELRKAAIDHMKLPGSNYVGIPHDRSPVNEFNNPALLPMIYPTLYPYGLGGCEGYENGSEEVRIWGERRTPLSMRAHIKHLFNISDRRFQEHYSFLFTAFNMLQRRQVLLQTHLKVKRSNSDRVASEFATVSPQTVHLVSERISNGDTQTANSDEERKVLRLMKEVNIILSRIRFLTV